MQSDGLNSAMGPVVYGYISLSINTQYKTKKCLRMKNPCIAGSAKTKTEIIWSFKPDLEL